MIDMFEYPNVTSSKPEEQIKEIVNYLAQFKETLEFALVNIGVSNLSLELQAQLIALGTDIKTSKKEQEEQFQQVAHSNLSVSDVINSQAYKASLKAVEDKIPTDYVTNGMQTQLSEEDGGVNIFTFTNADGTTDTFQCTNGNTGEKGDTPTLTFSINFETGNLEYEQT